MKLETDAEMTSALIQVYKTYNQEYVEKRVLRSDNAVMRLCEELFDCFCEALKPPLLQIWN